MPRTPQEEHNRGQKDYAETKDNFFGPSRRTPWCGPFESFEDYDKQVDAYNKGWDNAAKQDEGNKGGCFLTAACMKAKGLPDDCYELNRLRKFRDEYVLQFVDGKNSVQEYYKLSPPLIAAIDSLPDPLSIYHDLYESIIKPCIELIDSGKNKEAFDLYKSRTLEIATMLSK